MPFVWLAEGAGAMLVKFLFHALMMLISGANDVRITTAICF
jgi:hypothetical protein